LPQIIRSKHPVLTILKWLLAAVAVFYVFRKIDVASVWPVMLSANPWPLLACLTLLIAVSVLNAVRWKILLKAPDLGLMKYMYFVFVGHFFNLFMPSSAAAEALKVIAFGRRYGNLQRNIGITLVARSMGLVTQFGIGAVSTALYFRELRERGMFARISAPWTLIAVAMVSIACIALAAFRFRATLSKQGWIKAIVEVLGQRELLIRTALLTIAIQVLSALSGYCLYWSVFPHAPIGKVVFFILIIQAILMLPFSLGGVGIREYLVILFFSDLGGMPRETAMAANLLGYVPLVLMAGAGGLWILFRRHGPTLWGSAGKATAQGPEKDDSP
jgi:uncharacterized membrane protein YbhN (UPF0104 family)